MLEKVKSFALSFKEQCYPNGEDNTGQCMKASIELEESLETLHNSLSPARQTGYIKYQGKWWKHCWVNLYINGESYLLDVTADQFDYPGFILSPFKEQRENYLNEVELMYPEDYAILPTDWDKIPFENKWR